MSVPYSCPYIDRSISYLNQIKTLEHDNPAIAQLIQSIIEDLENVRAINKSLRADNETFVRKIDELEGRQP